MSGNSAGQALYLAARRLCAEGRFKAAAEALNRPHRMAGDDSWLLAAMASVCREEGAYEQACAWAESALRFEPESGVTHAELGLALAMLGRQDEAVRLLANAVVQPLPVRDHVILRLAETLFDAGDLPGAVSALGRDLPAAQRDDALLLLWICSVVEPSSGSSLVRDWPDASREGHVRTLVQGLLAAAADNRVYEADVVAQRLLRAAPESADALAAVGIWRMQQFRFDEAARFLGEAAFRGASAALAAELRLALIRYRQARYDDAIEILAGLPAPSPQIAAVRADCHLRLGQIRPARAWAEASLERAPDDMRARIVLWRTDPELGASDRLQRAEASLAHRPREAALLYWLADLIEEAAPDRARELAATALSIDVMTPAAAAWSARLGRPDGVAPRRTDSLSLVGLYAPKPDAGGCWPTEAQTRLLRLALEPDLDAGREWSAWCEANGIDDLDAATYRLLPMVFRRLSQSGAQDAPHFRTLFGIWRKSQFENVARLRRMLPALDRLAQAGIDVMPLKGGLTEQLYGDWGSRPMSDFDILVHRRDVERAYAAITAAGLGTNHACTADLLDFHYALTFRDEGGANLDLHWRALEEMVARDFPDEPFWSGAQPIEVLGRRFLQPTPTVRLFHTVVHGLRWNFIAPVRWVPDALLLLAKHGHDVDWSAMNDLATRLDCVLPLRYGLEYLAENFTIGRERVARAEVGRLVAAPIEETLWTLRTSSARHPCTLRELQDLRDHYAPLLARHPDTAMIVVGGTPEADVRAWCARAQLPWTPVLDRNRMTSLLGERKAFCVLADMNGRYAYQVV